MYSSSNTYIQKLAESNFHPENIGRKKCTNLDDTKWLMHCDKFFGDLPWWAVWSQSLWSWPCSPGRTQASLKMLPFLNPDVHKLCNHPPQLKHFKSQQSIRARKQLTRVTDCETARLWLCHLHFWGKSANIILSLCHLHSSEAAANIILSSWLLTQNFWGSGEYDGKVTGLCTSAHHHWAEQPNNSQNSQNFKHSRCYKFDPLVPIDNSDWWVGGLFKLEEKETSGVCTSVRSVHWHSSTHTLCCLTRSTSGCLAKWTAAGGEQVSQTSLFVSDSVSLQILIQQCCLPPPCFAQNRIRKTSVQGLQ